MSDVEERCVAQLRALMALYDHAPGHEGDARSAHDSQFITASLAAIDRISGPRSAYAEQARSLLAAYQNYHCGIVRVQFRGMIEALLSDVQSGCLTSIAELIHGEVFGDFLEMADHLLDEGYKDAAAVVGGGVLESHLRQLCAKTGIEVEITTGNDVKAKKADRLNSDLAGAGAYSKLDQKNVTAWLDLRNKAAHAKYGEYGKEQVALLLASVRDFVTRCPA